MPLSAALTEEIASSINDPNYFLFSNFPWSPDDTLRELLGGNADKYDLILKDAHAKTLIETRDRNVTCREWYVEPASQSALDKKAADLVQSVLQGFDFEQMISDIMANTLLKGNAFIEIAWDIDGKTTFIKDAIARPIHRFKFARIDPDVKYPSPIGTYRGYEIRVLTLGDLLYGHEVPDRRILCHAYGRINDNPWGIGLGRVLWWLAAIFKKEIIKQRLIFLDKYATPTARGKAPQSATKEQRAEFNTTINGLAKGGAAVLPYGWELDLLEATRSSSNDVFQGAIDWCNSEMSKLVLGETLSLELPSSGGSRAATQAHQEGSTVYLAKFDSDRLSSGPLQQLARWIVALNLPGAKPPNIWKRFLELDQIEDLNARVNRDNTLNSIGYKIKAEKVAEVYGDGYEDTAATASQSAANTPDIGFSESEYAAKKLAAFQSYLLRKGVKNGIIR